MSNEGASGFQALSHEVSTTRNPAKRSYLPVMSMARLAYKRCLPDSKLSKM